jgi:uncharacterized protein YjbI with pentapeptide repeats
LVKNALLKNALLKNASLKNASLKNALLKSALLNTSLTMKPGFVLADPTSFAVAPKDRLSLGKTADYGEKMRDLAFEKLLSC